MAGRAESIAARARSLIGVRYRPQGRSVEFGLDCVGLAALSLGLPPEHVTCSYGLRGNELRALEAELERHGLAPSQTAAPMAGDLGLFVPGPAQLHLAVFTDTGLVHADAGLRRVVERPLPAPWRVVGHWRVLAPARSGE
jgi:hypothetical protein